MLLRFLLLSVLPSIISTFFYSLHLHPDNSVTLSSFVVLVIKY